MKIPLLFRKNRLLTYRTGQRCCPCVEAPDCNWNLCFYPGSVAHTESNFAFKDEPEQKQIISYCQYQRYYGPNSLSFNKITRKNYEKMMKDFTSCTHPSEGHDVSEWRCYKCNGNVSSETERHENCH